MRNAKLIARLIHRGLIPEDANLMAWDEELGAVPAKSTEKLTKDEMKSAEDDALTEKRKTDGEDASLDDSEREAAWEKARDKKAKDAACSKDEEKEAEDDEHEDGEDEEEAEDESEEERGEDEEHEDGEDEEEEPVRDRRGRDADPDHRKDFRDLKSGGPPKGDKRGKDSRAHDSKPRRRESGLTGKDVEALLKGERTKILKEAAEAAKKTQRAMSMALDEVAPLVGRVRSEAFDSAESIYEFALEKAGIDTKGISKAALRAVAQSEARHAKRARPEVTHAQDEASLDDRVELDSIFKKTA